MNLAINYSTQAAVLLKTGHIQLDCFKTPDWPDLITEAGRHCPVAVHFRLRAEPHKLDNSDWEQITHLKAKTGVPYVNLHLKVKQGDIPNFSAPISESHLQEMVTERFCACLEILAGRFGPENVIAENIPYNGPGDEMLRQCAEPAIIRRALKTTNCGLLLDIPHARISAHYLGMEARDYISQLPVERLRELHFTGVHRLNGHLRDHLRALEEDWALLEWVLARIRTGEWPHPWLLAFEYGGVGAKFAWRSSAAVIAAQMPRLCEMVKGVGE